MDIDVENINKNDKNRWRNIYEAIDAPYFGEVKLFPKEFLYPYKDHPNNPQKQSNLNQEEYKNRIRRKFICAGGYDFSENNGSER